MENTNFGPTLILMEKCTLTLHYTSQLNLPEHTGSSRKCWAEPWIRRTTVYLLVEQRLLKTVKQQLDTFILRLLADALHHKVWNRSTSSSFIKPWVCEACRFIEFDPKPVKNTQQRPGLFVYKIRVEELEDSRQRHSSNFQALCDCVFYEVLD